MQRLVLLSALFSLTGLVDAQTLQRVHLKSETPK
ncbi:MAG: hypothetical protein ACJAQ3_003688, partial [Planctomycetota bacterium]